MSFILEAYVIAKIISQYIIPGDFKYFLALDFFVVPFVSRTLYIGERMNVLIKS